MKKLYLSIIVPSFNSAKTLKPLLESILTSTFTDFEVIVVDDASKDNTKELMQEYKEIGARYLQFKKREGPAAARNAGAEIAKGKILVFVDSDVTVSPEALKKISNHFKKRNIKVLMCWPDKKPANFPPKLFHYFKCMRDWAYWNVERDKKYPIGGFGGALGAIDKKFFKDLGGFNEKLPDMEDQEMGWRIDRVSEITFDPKIKIWIFANDFLPTLKKFYTRSYWWMKKFEKYKRFFGPAMNPSEAFIAGLANLSTVLILISLFIPAVWPMFFICFALRVYLGRKFLYLVFNEKGPLFLLISFYYSHLLYLAVYLGVARYILEKTFKKRLN